MRSPERQRANDAWFASIAASVSAAVMWFWDRPGPETAWWAPVAWWLALFLGFRAIRRRDRIDARRRQLRERIACGESDIYSP